MARHISGWSLLWRFGSLIIFLIAVFILNSFTGYVQNPLFAQVVGFLNSTLLVIILIWVFFIIADLFWSLASPFDLAYPLFNALGAVFVLTFVLSLIVFLADLFTTENIQSIVTLASYILYPLVFIITVVVGYMDVASRGEHRHHRLHHHYHHHH